VLNRWIAHEVAKTGREIGVALEAYKFNGAAASIYRFVWNMFCDWYLELVKPVLTGADGAAKDEHRIGVGRDRQALASIHALHHRRDSGCSNAIMTTRCRMSSGIWLPDPIRFRWFVFEGFGPTRSEPVIPAGLIRASAAFAEPADAIAR
jgi:hypothetical protein